MEQESIPCKASESTQRTLRFRLGCIMMSSLAGGLLIFEIYWYWVFLHPRSTILNLSRGGIEEVVIGLMIVFLVAIITTLGKAINRRGPGLLDQTRIALPLALLSGAGWLVTMLWPAYIVKYRTDTSAKPRVSVGAGIDIVSPRVVDDNVFIFLIRPQDGARPDMVVINGAGSDGLEINSETQSAPHWLFRRHVMMTVDSAGEEIEWCVTVRDLRNRGYLKDDYATIALLDNKCVGGLDNRNATSAQAADSWGRFHALIAFGIEQLRNEVLDRPQKRGSIEYRGHCHAYSYLQKSGAGETTTLERTVQLVVYTPKATAKLKNSQCG